MTTLINIFCAIGIVGIIVFAGAFAYVIKETRPLK
jgi:hypothetical protein